MEKLGQEFGLKIISTIMLAKAAKDVKRLLIVIQLPPNPFLVVFAKMPPSENSCLI